MLLTVRAVLPVLLIVRVAVAVVLTVKLPNARFPERAMIFVGTAAMPLTAADNSDVAAALTQDSLTEFG